MTSNFYYSGIASNEYRVASYKEFADNVIPRIKKQDLIYPSMNNINRNQFWYLRL